MIKQIDNEYMNYQWCLVSQVSKSQFTEVWKVVSKLNGETHVAKISSHPKYNYIIDHESQLLKSLSHPNINKLVDTLNFGTHKAIIVEKAPGEDLDQIIKSTKLSIRECIEIALNVIEALEELHSSKTYEIVHRDIKPANIMYCCETKKVTLVDFGLSSPLNNDRVCLSDVLGGTLPYTPPELWIPTNDERKAIYDSAHYTNQADIYALGLTIYELITRRSAYSESGADLVPRLFNGDIEPIERYVSLSKELQSVFGQWLSASLKKRFKSISHLRIALKKCPELKNDSPINLIADGKGTMIFDVEDKLGYLPTSLEISNSKEAQRKLIESKKEEIEARVKRDTHGHYLITGVPGSGKTYTLVLRALYLSNKNPNWKIGIMCFNSNLRAYIEQMLTILQNNSTICGEMNFTAGENISVFTRDAICYKILMIPYQEGESISPDEWDEIRSKALQCAKPQFDALLIDEYQDFEEKSFELAKKLCIKKKNIDGTEYEALTLVGDPAQAINRKRHSRENLENWGIRTPGRERWLPSSYRVNKMIFEICNKLFRHIYSKNAYRKMKECASDSLAPIGRILKAVGPKKQVVQTIISRLIDNNIDPKDILIIDVQYKYKSKRLINELNNGFANIKIAPYLTSKGLEAPVVLILDASNIFSRSDMQIETERAKAQLYMMLTRASHTLIIHDSEANSYVHTKIDAAAQSIGHQCIEIDFYSTNVMKQLFIKYCVINNKFTIIQNDPQKRVDKPVYKGIQSFLIENKSEPIHVIKSRIKVLYPTIEFIFEDDEKLAA